MLNYLRRCVQENIGILNVTIFCVQTKECCNIQLLHLLRVKGLCCFSSPLRNKENTEDFKKYLMNVSHKISEFRPLFSRKQRKNKSCAVSKYVYNPYTYIFLRKHEQTSDILLISLKRGWSDLEGILCGIEHFDHSQTALSCNQLLRERA